MNMKRKIFAGLCAFSMAVGAKGGSEKVAATPIDKVRYGAQALLSAIQTGAFGWIIESRLTGHTNEQDFKYWGKNGKEKLLVAGVHLTALNGLENLISSGYDLLKSDPEVKRNLNFENFDKNKSKPTPVDVKDKQKANSFVVSKVKYGVQALASAIQTVVMACGICSQLYNKFIRKVHQSPGPKQGQPYTYFSTDKSRKFVEIASLVAFVNGLLSLGSSSYDLLKPEPEKRNIKSPNASPNSEKNKLEKDLKDKK